MTRMMARCGKNSAALWVLLVALLPIATTSLANRLPETVKSSNPLDFVKNVIARPADEQLEEDPGKLFLKELNLTSSTVPKRFSAKPQQLPSLFAASLPAIFRLASGVFANGYSIRIAPRNQQNYTILPLGDDYQVEEEATILPKFIPSQPLILYETEACISCKRVREAVSMLSLTVTFRPCPKKGTSFRRENQGNVPLLMDPNTGIELSGADSIIQYLFKTYANGDIPWTLQNGLLDILGSMALALGGGQVAKPSNPPVLPLTLYAYEGSPFCKVVRDSLTELELEHTLKACPRGSWNRQELFENQGRFQVPLLQDPNTGVSLYESEAIVEYLNKIYGVTPSPVKYL